MKKIVFEFLQQKKRLSLIKNKGTSNRKLLRLIEVVTSSINDKTLWEELKMVRKKISATKISQFFLLRIKSKKN